jgi:competence protein ComEA
VHVVGAVNHPGVYWLSSGARVEEAVTQAGGFRGDADASSVNLAALVQDGQQVRVEYTAAPAEPAPPAAVPQPPATATAPAPAAAPETPPAKTATGRRLGPSLDLAHVRPVSLSTASQAQLEELPKIGPALAANIVHYRTQHGPFRSVDDLVNVPGFGDQRLEALRPYVMP